MQYAVLSVLFKMCIKGTDMSKGGALQVYYSYLSFVNERDKGQEIWNLENRVAFYFVVFDALDLLLLQLHVVKFVNYLLSILFLVIGRMENVLMLLSLLDPFLDKVKSLVLFTLLFTNV